MGAVRTAIRGSYVIGYENGDHVMLEDAEVVYEDALVIFIGHSFPGPVDRRISVGRAVISPGLIDLDALADVDHALIDTWQSPEMQLGLHWSQRYVDKGPRETLTTEQRAFRRLFALVNLVRNGTTTAMPIAAETHGQWAETHEDLVETASIADRIGIPYVPRTELSGRREGRP